MAIARISIAAALDHCGMKLQNSPMKFSWCGERPTRCGDALNQQRGKMRRTASTRILTETTQWQKAKPFGLGQRGSIHYRFVRAWVVVIRKAGFDDDLDRRAIGITVDLQRHQLRKHSCPEATLIERVSPRNDALDTALRPPLPGGMMHEGLGADTPRAPRPQFRRCLACPSVPIREPKLKQLPAP
jgi:hypothetical protein